MAAIKRFFEKRKLDIKFKKAGEGHVLKSDSSASVSAESLATSLSPPSSMSPQRAPLVLSMEQKMAADAALARMNQQKTGMYFELKFSLNFFFCRSTRCEINLLDRCDGLFNKTRCCRSRTRSLGAYCACARNKLASN